jgi:hypothetical protein
VLQVPLETPQCTGKGWCGTPTRKSTLPAPPLQIGNMVSGWGPSAPNKLVFLIRHFFDALIQSTDETVQYYRCGGTHTPRPPLPLALALTRPVTHRADTYKQSTLW